MKRGIEKDPKTEALRAQAERLNAWPRKRPKISNGSGGNAKAGNREPFFSTLTLFL